MAVSILTFLFFSNFIVYSGLCQNVSYKIHDEIALQIWNGDNPILYSHTRYIDKRYPHTAIRPVLIETILKYTKPLFWLEVGSMLGGSAIITADVMTKLNINTSLVCVDPFTGLNLQ